MTTGTRCADPTHERRADGRCGTCRKDRLAEWREANPSYDRQRHAELYASNKELILEKNRAYRRDNAGKVREHKAAKYRAPGVAEAIADKGRERREGHRRQVFEHYGTECACCGLDVLGLLTIDHVDPDAKTVKFQSGDKLYPHLIKSGFPTGLQTLCYGCNLGKHSHRAVCPHQRAPKTVGTGAQSLLKLKSDAIKAYGGVCACCEEDNVFLLTLDHVNGDGAEHRRALVANGIKVPQGIQFYRHLRKNNWPNEPLLRTLCGTCNRGMWRFQDGCPCGGAKARLARIELRGGVFVV